MSRLRAMVDAIKEAREVHINTKNDEIVFGLLEKKDGKYKEQE